MKTGSIICLALFVIGALLSLVQLWFAPLESETFLKVAITLGVIFVVALGITLVKREYIENQSLKKDKFID
ncbi:hypothetical protein ACMXYN_11575 [Neptuniibacter sp. PT8_73]|uniref:hypothetical protein n=1 Tax=unclassified Neptuniibacter TaxID=2630693 RepID=UPI0039F6810A